MNYVIDPVEEKERLAALEELQILNTAPEQNYDDITRLAAFICEVPISMVTLVGKESQWFKSRVGTNLTGSARDISFCSEAILSPDELLEIQDTRKDPRFASNPFTTSEVPLIFYAGVPLKSNTGKALGTLCVLDCKPHSLKESQKAALQSLAKQVENLFELRRQNMELQKVKDELNSRNSQLKEFVGTVSHDMKMPLANMIITSDMLRAKYSGKMDKQGLEYLNYLKQSSLKLSNYITGLLEHYESDTLPDLLTEDFDIHDLLEQIIDLLNINYKCSIHLPPENRMVHCNRSALQQIFLNLLSNSLKYNDQEDIEISVDFSEDDKFYHFTVTDNGIGIPADKKEEIFELFKVVAEVDRTGNRGNGIGLSTVKKLITSLGGEISVTSEVNKGTSFKFSLKRTDLV